VVAETTALARPTRPASRSGSGTTSTCRELAGGPRWTPNDDVAERERQLRLWKKAVTKSMDWVDDDVR
jgi:glycerol kinase